MNDAALLTVEEMYKADGLAIEAGTPSLELMENAGSAIVDEIIRRWDKRPVSVLCGPGNNGGDGFVVARLLQNKGWPVRLALMGAADRLTGDAAVNAERWQGNIEPLTSNLLDGNPLVIDALFGAGLTRPLEGAALECVQAINDQGLDCLGIDVPSGVHGDSGEVLGAAPRCRLSVTFFRPKPGHLLMPGRERAGELVVADIGIPEKVLSEIAPKIFVNSPGLWADKFPRPALDAHKYTRGHVVIRGGDDMTGAAQLAAVAARRTGAGLVTISAGETSANIYRAGQPGNLVTVADNITAFKTSIDDPRRNVIVMGPGMGVSPETRDFVHCALDTDKPIVLDADALSAFAEQPDALISRLNENHVLTPHEGEFARLFDFSGDKLTRARQAAAQSGANILLKGPDTVIAAPNGRAVINSTGSPYLATAGSGDVLSGVIAGLLAQGKAPFDAACSGAWLHGRAGELFGPGLIAEDLSDMIPDVLGEILLGET
jgi:ADP-dependent NAD(P)H-hydrate dehydratase / NAD(P)H-hydrate epimerase